jgi:hypothetical protein
VSNLKFLDLYRRCEIVLPTAGLCTFGNWIHYEKSQNQRGWGTIYKWGYRYGRGVTLT